jgi:hypothetical protein
VFPGLWDLNDTPSQVQSTMTGWHNQCGIVGGFMWLYDDFVGNGLAAQYASAINTAVASSGFTLSGPSSVFLNQSSNANAAITITDLNGFTGKVTFQYRLCRREQHRSRDGNQQLRSGSFYCGHGILDGDRHRHF